MYVMPTVAVWVNVRFVGTPVPVNQETLYITIND